MRILKEMWLTSISSWNTRVFLWTFILASLSQRITSPFSGGEEKVYLSLPLSLHLSVLHPAAATAVLPQTARERERLTHITNQQAGALLCSENTINKVYQSRPRRRVPKVDERTWEKSSSRIFIWVLNCFRCSRWSYAIYTEFHLLLSLSHDLSLVQVENFYRYLDIRQFKMLLTCCRQKQKQGG